MKYRRLAGRGLEAYIFTLKRFSALSWERRITAMGSKIITLENRSGAFQMIFQRVMRMVPDRDKDDKRLQRLLAFRVQADGEAATCEYLMRHIRDYVRHPNPKSFYEFLHAGVAADLATALNGDADPPGAA